MLSRISIYAAVALAAAIGGSLRYGVSIVWLQAASNGWSGLDWPWPTLIVNVLGSFLIAVYWRLAGPDARFAASIERRTVVMTGFCGGLTTFSMFGVETLYLLDQARWAGAIAYVMLTGIGALVATWWGLQDFRHGAPRVE